MDTLAKRLTTDSRPLHLKKRKVPGINHVRVQSPLGLLNLVSCRAYLAKMSFDVSAAFFPTEQF